MTSVVFTIDVHIHSVAPLVLIGESRGMAAGRALISEECIVCAKGRRLKLEALISAPCRYASRDEH